MIKSMTGFGKGEYSDEKRTVTCEIRSVNHRYGDVSIKMPKRYSFAEDAVKKAILAIMKRGKIEAHLMVESTGEEDVSIRLNTAAARQYMDNLQTLKREFDLAGEVSIDLIAQMPDVLRTVPDVEDEEAIRDAMLKATEKALGSIDAMRIAEGEKLRQDLDMRGELINGYVKQIEERAPEVGKIYAEKLKERIAEVLEEHVEVPEDRILLEAAIFADKSNITEELVRLHSHVEQLHSILDGDGVNGKKLDFLVQEMNREANTIGSKANDLDLTTIMLEIKSEVEKIREQVQNIE